MHLTLEDGSEVRNPTHDEIATALSLVDGRSNSFAILESSPASFIQIAGDAAAGFVIEYHTASPNQHYQLVGPAKLEQAVWLFQAYARGDDTWRSVAQWQPIEL